MPAGEAGPGRCQRIREGGGDLGSIPSGPASLLLVLTALCGLPLPHLRGPARTSFFRIHRLLADP